MQLEKQAPPKHLVAALDPAVPVNQGKADAPKAVEKTPKVPVAVASEPLQKPSKAALPAVVSKAALKEDRGDQMASALARLLGEPQAAVAHKPRSMARVIPSIPKPQKDGPWRIQTSMFSDSYKAKALVDHLQSKGYNVALKPKADGFYVVYISGFNDEDAALTAQENLSREEGLSTSLIRP